MSIRDDAQVSIILADYANEDAAKKINMLGAGWNITGVQPNGLIPEQAVLVVIELPAVHRGDTFAASLKLINEAGDPVVVSGPDGTPTPLRIQHLVTVDPPIALGVAIPNHVASRRQILMRFPNGIPLAPNVEYRWVFEIDGSDKAHVSFYVAGPPPGPVIG